MSMSRIKKLCICAMCAALCCVLPFFFHRFGIKNVARMVSPMHFPVLLCGLTCGWSYGGVCGVIGPLLAFLFDGEFKLHMIAELVTYGVVTGLLMKYIRTGRTCLDLYLSMLPAMLLGRVVGGLAEALLTSENFFAFFVGSYFVETAPGAVAQLIVIPALYLALTAARLIPARYQKTLAA